MTADRDPWLALAQRLEANTALAGHCEVCHGLHIDEYSTMSRLVEQSFAIGGRSWQLCWCGCCQRWQIHLGPAVAYGLTGFHLEVFGEHPPGWPHRDVVYNPTETLRLCLRLSIDDRPRLANLISPLYPADFADLAAASDADLEDAIAEREAREAREAETAADRAEPS